jgi:hypothetical protein
VVSQALVVVLFTVGLAAFYVVALRWTRDRVLARLVALAYVTRALLAIGLYAASARGWPFLRGLQMGEGFWTFAPDASSYHHYAATAAIALGAGLELPPAYGDPDYPALLSALYSLAGPQPLVAIWANVALASLTALLTYSLVRTVSSIGGARVAVALVAFWPSGVLWSTQLLKDTPTVFLIVAFFWCLHRLRPWAARRPGFATAGVAFVGACVSLFLVYRVRDYVGVTLLASALVTLTATAIVGRWTRRDAALLLHVAMAIGLVAAVWSATWIRLDGFGKPPDPARAHRRLAEHLVSIGDLDGALFQLQTAHVGKKGAAVDAAAQDALARAELAQMLADRRPPPAMEPAPPRIRLEFVSEALRKVELLKISEILSRRRVQLGRPSSVVAPEDISTRDARGVVEFAPTAVVNALFTPHPWSRLEGSGATGVFRTVAMVEVMLVFVLVVCSVAGLVPLFRRAWPTGLTLVVFCGLLTVGLGYAVPVIGILFRLRLAVIVPLCLLAASGPLPVVVGRAWQWLRPSGAPVMDDVVLRA